MKLQRSGRVRLVLDTNVVVSAARLISIEDKEFVVNNFDKFSIKIVTKSKFDAIKDDPDDNKFIEAAIDGRADYIISGDAHLQEVVEFGNIRILSPKEFLDDFAKKHIQ